MKILRLFFTLAALVCFQPAFADDLDDANTAYKNGDYETALQIFNQHAEQGVADAQFELGVMYEHGRGVTQDDSEAVKWYRKAAKQGMAAAQYNLGVMYARSLGVMQDLKNAAKWYRKAAEQGMVIDRSTTKNNVPLPPYLFGRRRPSIRIYH